MNKKVKIALGVIGALLLVGLVYWYFSKGRKADKPFGPLAPGAEYDAFCIAVKAALGETDLYSYKYNGKTAESLAIAYFKTKNYAATAKNVGLFSSEMVAYIKNPTSKPHWEIS